MATWSILLPFGIFCGLLLHFVVYQEKSGNLYVDGKKAFLIFSETTKILIPVQIINSIVN
jgi:hypothetical protein